MGLKAFLFDENIIQGGISRKPVTSVTPVTGERDIFEERAAIMQFDSGLIKRKPKGRRYYQL